MCGRFTLTYTIQEVAERFSAGIADVSFGPNDNITPGMDIPVVTADCGSVSIKAAYWGFIPRWSKEEKPKLKPINARAETVAGSRIFSHAFRQSRILIPASGFFEWRKVGKEKKKYRIYLKEKQLFAFAGIAEENVGPKGKIRFSCAIITTAANKAMSKVHGRMPAILPRKAEKEWLKADPDSAEKLQKLLVPYRENDLIIEAE